MYKERPFALGVYRSFDILGFDSSRLMTSSKPLMFSVTKNLVQENF